MRTVNYCENRHHDAIGLGGNRRLDEARLLDAVENLRRDILNARTRECRGIIDTALHHGPVSVRCRAVDDDDSELGQ